MADLESDFDKIPLLPKRLQKRLFEWLGWSQEVIERLDLRLLTYYRKKRAALS